MINRNDEIIQMLKIGIANSICEKAKDYKGDEFEVVTKAENKLVKDLEKVFGVDSLAGCVLSNIIRGLI